MISNEINNNQNQTNEINHITEQNQIQMQSNENNQLNEIIDVYMDNIEGNIEFSNEVDNRIDIMNQKVITLLLVLILKQEQ